MPLLPPTATYYGGDVANDNYFLRKGQAIPSGQPLVAPVSIKSPDLSKTANINVDNTDGFISLSTGANSVTGGPPRLGLVLNSGSSGIVASVGDSTIASTPTLQLAGQVSGTPTISQVTDPVYNPATAQELVNILGPDPTTNYPNGWLGDSPNDGTIFSSAGSAAFTVPKTGLYMFQGTASMAPATVSAGGSAGGAFSLQATIHLNANPFTAIGGIVIGQPTPLSANPDYRSYYCWNGYVSLVAGTLYSMDVRMLSGGGTFLPPNLINNDKYADLKFQLIKIA
jgi:hypothetical protein